ncbi:MAG: hypothetical protein RXR65_08415 [Hydrogenobaculum sp.]
MGQVFHGLQVYQGLCVHDVVNSYTMILPKYRLLGLEVSEMAEYKYPNSSCTEQHSFVQFG